MARPLAAFGIDREAVVPAVVDQVAGQRADRVEGDAGAVPLGATEMSMPA